MNIVHQFKTSFSLAYAKNKGLVARCNAGSTMIHDFHTGEEIARVKKPSHPSNLLFSMDEKFLIIKNTSGKIYVYETDQFQVVSIFKKSKAIEMIEREFLYDHVQNKIMDVVKINGYEQVVTFDVETKEMKQMTFFEEEGFYFIRPNQQIDQNYYFTVDTLCEKKGDFINQLLILKIHNDSIEQTILESEFSWSGIQYIPSLNQYFINTDQGFQLVNHDFRKVESEIILSNKFDISPIYNLVELSTSEETVMIPLRDMLVIIQLKPFEIIQQLPFKYLCFAQYINLDEQILIGTWDKGFIVENDFK